MSAEEVWQVFRRRWWVVAVVAVAAALGALLYSLAQPATYRAHAEVVVLPNRADYGLSMFLEARMRTFRAVLLSLPQVQDELPDDLGGRTHVRLVPEEGLVLIEVDDSDPEQAAYWANTLADRLRAWVEENRPQVGTSKIYVELLSPAKAPDVPSSPRTKLNTAAGAVLGALLGLPLAFLWHFLDDALDDSSLSSARLGIAVWPALPPFPLGDAVLLREPTGEIAAAFHRLHAYLRLAGSAGEAAGRPPTWKTLAVAGVTRGDLPAALLANLGAAMAQDGGNVLLVDADFGRPALHEPFALPPIPSLGEFLWEGGQGALAPAATGRAGLYLLPAGENLSPAMQAVALRRAAQALPALARSAGTVLIRFPGPLEAPEGLLLASEADAVLLVGRAGRTRCRDVQRVVGVLRAAGTKVLGLALWQERRSR